DLPSLIAGPTLLPYTTLFRSKMLNETGVKQLVQRMELDAIADRKLPIRQQRMRDLEDILYFVLDEKGHSVHLTDRGAEALSPDRSEEHTSELQSRENLVCRLL